MLKRTIAAVMFGVVCTFVYAQIPNITDFIKEVEATKVASGMFTTYRSNKNIYWEIPDSLIKREFAVSTTILKAPARPDRDMDRKFGYAGDMIGPVFFGFKKDDDVFWITDPLHDRFFEDPSGTYSKIAAQRGNERLYKRLPILAVSNNSTLVDVSELLVEYPLFTLEIVSYDLMVGSHIKDKVNIKDIKGYDDRLLMHISRSYQSSSMQIPGQSTPPSYVGDWDTGICIKLLTAEPLEPLITNSGAYFRIGKEYFEGNQPAVQKSFAKRWRLEIKTEDREKYKRGEKVKPIQPIVFHIDRNTPPKYVNSIIEGVRSWNAAFEKAGFKDAIDARLAPTLEEDPDFSIYNSKYPFISWKISGSNNAYGPTPCEPRSAEIINSHIAIFSNVLNLQQKWYFAQSGANDPQAWNTVLPDSLLYQFMKQIVIHEVGHTLGLEHNFLGSSHFSIDQLRDNDFISKNGISSSVMDYVRCNYALGPQDKVELKNRQAWIGDYDTYAIEWAYRIFPGKDATERTRNRALWNKEKQKNSINHFSGRTGVYAQAEDLGNDHVAINSQGIENLKYLCEHPEVWKVTDKQSLHVWQGRYHSVITHYKQWVDHVLSHLGGKSISKDDSQQIYLPEKAAYNRKALLFIQNYVLQPPLWMFNEELTTKLEVDGGKELQKLYNELIPHLIHSLQRVDQTEHASEDMLSVKEFLQYIHEGLFAEWTNGEPVSKYKFSIQVMYVTQLSNLLKRSENISSSNLLINVMQALNQIKDEGLVYHEQASNATVQKQVMYLMDKI